MALDDEHKTKELEEGEEEEEGELSDEEDEEEKLQSASTSVVKEEKMQPTTAATPIPAPAAAAPAPAPVKAETHVKPDTAPKQEQDEEGEEGEEEEGEGEEEEDEDEEGEEEEEEEQEEERETRDRHRHRDDERHSSRLGSSSNPEWFLHQDVHHARVMITLSDLSYETILSLSTEPSMSNLTASATAAGTIPPLSAMSASLAQLIRDLLLAECFTDQESIPATSVDMLVTRHSTATSTYQQPMYYGAPATRGKEHISSILIQCDLHATFDTEIAANYFVSRLQGLTSRTHTYTAVIERAYPYHPHRPTLDMMSDANQHFFLSLVRIDRETAFAAEQKILNKQRRAERKRLKMEQMSGVVDDEDKLTMAEQIAQRNREEKEAREAAKAALKNIKVTSQEAREKFQLTPAGQRPDTIVIRNLPTSLLHLDHHCPHPQCTHWEHSICSDFPPADPHARSSRSSASRPSATLYASYRYIDKQVNRLLGGLAIKRWELELVPSASATTSSTTESISQMKGRGIGERVTRETLTITLKQTQSTTKPTITAASLTSPLATNLYIMLSSYDDVFTVLDLLERKRLEYIYSYKCRHPKRVGTAPRRRSHHHSDDDDDELQAEYEAARAARYAADPIAAAIEDAVVAEELAMYGKHIMVDFTYGIDHKGFLRFDMVESREDLRRTHAIEDQHRADAERARARDAAEYEARREQEAVAAAEREAEDVERMERLRQEQQARVAQLEEQYKRNKAERVQRVEEWERTQPQEQPPPEQQQQQPYPPYPQQGPPPEFGHPPPHAHPYPPHPHGHMQQPGHYPPGHHPHAPHGYPPGPGYPQPVPPPGHPYPHDYPAPAPYQPPSQPLRIDLFATQPPPPPEPVREPTPPPMEPLDFVYRPQDPAAIAAVAASASTSHLTNVYVQEQKLKSSLKGTGTAPGAAPSTGVRPMKPVKRAAEFQMEDDAAREQAAERSARMKEQLARMKETMGEDVSEKKHTFSNFRASKQLESLRQQQQKRSQVEQDEDGDDAMSDSEEIARANKKRKGETTVTTIPTPTSLGGMHPSRAAMLAGTSIGAPPPGFDEHWNSKNRQSKSAAANLAAILSAERAAGVPPKKFNKRERSRSLSRSSSSSRDRSKSRDRGKKKKKHKSKKEKEKKKDKKEKKDKETTSTTGTPTTAPLAAAPPTTTVPIIDATAGPVNETSTSAVPVAVSMPAAVAAPTMTSPPVAPTTPVTPAAAATSAPPLLSPSSDDTSKKDKKKEKKKDKKKDKDKRKKGRGAFTDVATDGTTTTRQRSPSDSSPSRSKSRSRSPSKSRSRSRSRSRSKSRSRRRRRSPSSSSSDSYDPRDQRGQKQKGWVNPYGPKPKKNQQRRGRSRERKRHRNERSTLGGRDKDHNGGPGLLPLPNNVDPNTLLPMGPMGMMAPYMMEFGGPMGMMPPGGMMDARRMMMMMGGGIPSRRDERLNRGGGDGMMMMDDAAQRHTRLRDLRRAQRQPLTSMYDDFE